MKVLWWARCAVPAVRGQCVLGRAFGVWCSQLSKEPMDAAQHGPVESFWQEFWAFPRGGAAVLGAHRPPTSLELKGRALFFIFMSK